MKIALAIAALIFGAAVIAFAALNPNLEVRFSAAFVEYQGNTLGLCLVLVTLAIIGYRARDLLKNLVRWRRRVR